MKPLALLLFVIVMNAIFGSAVESILNTYFHLNSKQPLLLLPIIGMAFLTCITQLLYLLLATKYISIIIWIMLILSTIYFSKSLFQRMNIVFQKKKVIFIFAFTVIICYLLPMLISNQLMSYQYANNDIIFYLATDDWMVNHSFFKPIIYSQKQPYFVVAQYILKTTRFGTNVLESTIMSMFGLASHEVFSLIGIIYIIYGIFGIYYLLRYVLRITEKNVLIIELPIALHLSWKQLLIQSYVPQLAGTCYLIVFIASLISYFNDESKGNRYNASLFLAATACTYAEYSSYMFIIFMGLLFIHMIISSRKKQDLLSSLKLVLYGFLINPFGIWIAMVFNYHIFLSVKQATGSIDAFGGKLKSIVNIFELLIGGMETKSTPIIHAVVIAIIIVILIIFFIWLIREHSELHWDISWILFFFMIYEVYFRHSHIAYGEYKHILGIGPLVFALLFYVLYSFIGKKSKNGLIIVNALCVLLFSYISFSWTKVYTYSTMHYYNNELLDVSNALKLVPKNDSVGLYSDAYYLQHEMIYVAKNHNVQLMGTCDNSYYSASFNIKLNNDLPKYILMPSTNSKLGSLPYDHDIIWENDRYQLDTNIKDYKTYAINDPIELYGMNWNASDYIIKGISTGEDGFTWTDGDMIEFSPLKLEDYNDRNIGDAELTKKYILQIDVANVYNKNQRLQVKINNNIVFDEEVTRGGVINIPFDYNRSSSENLTIICNLPDAVSPNDLGLSSDNRKLALALKTIKILDFSDVR